MNNLLHDIIHEEMNSLVKTNITAFNQTKLLKCIIREELLKESGAAGWRWAIYGEGNIRYGAVNRKAQNNNAEIGFPLIGRATRGSKGAPAEMLRRDAIGWLTQNKQFGPGGYYNKKTYMYVLSNPIRLTKKVVKFHVWIYNKNIFNNVWNKIKPIIQDKQSNVFFDNQKMVTELNNVTIHTPEQAEGWKRQLVDLVKEFGIDSNDQDLKDDLFQLRNAKPKKIRGDVKLKTTKPFKMTVDDKGFDVKGSGIVSPWMKNGEVLVKYSPDGMNLQIFPIKGTGNVREVPNEQTGRLGNWNGLYTGDYDKTTHTPTKGQIEVDIKDSRNPMFHFFRGELNSTRTGTWEDPKFIVDYIKGQAHYYDPNLPNKQYGIFIGTFDLIIERPNTGKAQGVKVTYFENNKAPVDSLYLGDVQNRKPVGEGEWYKKEIIPSNLIFKGKGPWPNREGTEYYPEDKDGIYEQGVWKNNTQFNVIQYNAYGQKLAEYKDGEFESDDSTDLVLDKDEKSPSVEKIKKDLLKMEQTESFPSDSALLIAFKESVAKKPDLVDKITLNFVKAIKQSWKTRIGYDEDIQATQGRITEKFTDTLWKVVNLPAEANESTQHYSNVKDIILQEYKKIMKEQ